MDDQSSTLNEYLPKSFGIFQKLRWGEKLWKIRVIKT